MDNTFRWAALRQPSMPRPSQERIRAAERRRGHLRSDFDMRPIPRIEDANDQNRRLWSVSLVLVSVMTTRRSHFSVRRT